MSTRSKWQSLCDWFDERTGLCSIGASWLASPMAGGAQWGRAVVAALIGLFCIQAVTGLALMMVYVPSTLSAWASVHYITDSLRWGWLIRGVHRCASDLFITLMLVHIARLFFLRLYRRPHEFNWWLSLAAFALVVSEAISGHILRWDQHAYWARKVEFNILGNAPVVGPWIQSILQGGSSLGAASLTRFYTAHIVLIPIVLFSLTAVAVRSAYRNGQRAAHAGIPTQPYFPQQAIRDVFAVFLVVFGVICAAILSRSWAMHLDAPADPTRNYPARPEWFLLPLFQLRSLVHGRFENIFVLTAPLVILGYAFVLPWLEKDRFQHTSFIRSIVVRMPLLLVAIGALALAELSRKADTKDTQFQKAKSQANHRAHVAIKIARQGVPPEGPLTMMRNDPNLRSEDLYIAKCAMCHVLGEWGDPKEAKAPKLDGWSTEEWIEQFLHNPDADQHFGRTDFRGKMPSVDIPPPDRKPTDVPFTPMSREDRKAVAVFLASEGDEPGEIPVPRDQTLRARGESIVKDRCTSCHLFRGEGDDNNVDIAPELSKYGSIAWVRAQIANPATKQTYREKALDSSIKNHMPRFDHELSNTDIDWLAHWVREQARLNFSTH